MQTTGFFCNSGLPSAGPASCPPIGTTPCGLAPPENGRLQFAVIGDWGDNVCLPSCAASVAGMVQGWNSRWPLDFIVTTGDNFYPAGSPNDVAKNIGMYSSWFPTQPKPGEGPRFFPTLGNHDLYTNCGQPYYDYFSALAPYSPTGKARYYHYPIPGGLVDLFALDSDASEPDGVGVNCKQARWLKAALAASKEARPNAWRIIIMHVPPFSTRGHDEGTNNPMNWPFAEWGASLVLTGHIHSYERIERNHLTYIINGLGGVKGAHAIRDDEGCVAITGTQTRYNRSLGAMIGTATASQMQFCFMAIDATHPDGVCVDTFTITR
jgi:tartrate-resistant acid phosphatase type 5